MRRRSLILVAALLAMAPGLEAQTTAPDPASTRSTSGLPVPPFVSDLVLADPDWARLAPQDQVTAIGRRIEQRGKDPEVARWHLTRGWLLEELGRMVEAAEAYAAAGRLLDRFRWAGQAKLRAADLYLAAAKASPKDEAKLVKHARRELDGLVVGLQRGGAQPIQLWAWQEGRWVPSQDPYGLVLKRIDDLSRESPVYRAIDFLVLITGNIPGWSHVLALILLALVLKLVTHPLTRKSYKSMAGMQKLQPQLQELQKKHKDKPDVLQREMMKVYQEHGVSPMSGCLPMLIQMPVFIIVYQGIRAYTFHYHQVAFLWIPSLAAPDTLLLLLYGISMYFQQKLMTARQPAPTDPQQAQMQKTMSWMMPVMFTYMMYIWRLPSAFYLYWLTFNIIGTLEQGWIAKQRDAEPVPASPPPLTVLEGERDAAARARRVGRASGGKKRRKH